MESILPLMNGQKGHFKFESGYHSELWLDLTTLFLNPKKLTPFVQELSKQFKKYNLDGICGAFAGGAFLAEMVAQELDIEFFYTERIVHPENKGLFPVEYLLPKSFGQAIKGKRIGIIDDVVSAGSATKGTYESLRKSGANIVVAGSLLLVGDMMNDFLKEKHIAFETLEKIPNHTWLPQDCPLCKKGISLKDLVD